MIYRQNLLCLSSDKTPARKQSRTPMAKPIMVGISASQHAAIKEYSADTGVSMTKVISDALDDAIENVLPARRAALCSNLKQKPARKAAR